MERRYLTREEMLRVIGILEVSAIQFNVSDCIGTSQSVISRLWSCYRDTSEVAERHIANIRITTARQDRFLKQQQKDYFILKLHFDLISN